MRFAVFIGCLVDTKIVTRQSICVSAIPDLTELVIYNTITRFLNFQVRIGRGSGFADRDA